MVEVGVAPTEVVMKKKAYHHGDLRNAIIIQATARARSEGERAIVLREIAAEIGVSATAAYRHFTNRQQLVEEVAARGFTAMGERVAQESVAGPGVDPALAAYADLRNACYGLVGFTVAEPAWARMMVEVLGGSATVIHSAREVQAVMQAIVDRGVEAGLFESGTVLYRNRVFWAGIDGLCTHAMFGIYPVNEAMEEPAIARVIDLSMSDLLTDAGRAAVAAAELSAGIVTSL